MGSLRVGHNWVTSLSCTGEGNGNPLQCSCLENPGDGEAWWAAVYGVSQSWTRLKRFSSSRWVGWEQELEGGPRGRSLHTVIHFIVEQKPTHHCKATIHAQFLSCVRLFETPWTVAHQAPLSMEFSRQEYWSGLPFPPPGDLPNPEIELVSPALAGGFFTTEPPGKP